MNKARIGDYIRFDASISKVTGIRDINGQVTYLLENGREVADGEIIIEDVLLESEVQGL